MLKNISIKELNLEPALVAELVELFANDIISSRIAKDIFPEVIEKEFHQKLVEEKGLIQILILN